MKSFSFLILFLLLSGPLKADLADNNTECPAGTIRLTDNLIPNYDFSILHGSASPENTPLSGGTWQTEAYYVGENLYPGPTTVAGKETAASIFTGTHTGTVTKQWPFPGDPAYSAPAQPNFLYTNGNDLGRPYSLWKTTLTGLMPNSTYTYVSYVSNVIDPAATFTTYDPTIQLYVDGVALGSAFTVLRDSYDDQSDDVWTRFEQRFTTGAAQTSAVLEIRDSTIGIYGDDLAVAGVGGFMCAPLDYSDGPASYGNSSHAIVSGIQLGAMVTAESSAVQDADNTSDDGVIIPALVQGQVNTIPVTVTGSGGYLQGWIDWNGDGDFDDIVDGIAEQISINAQDQVTTVPGRTDDADTVSGQISVQVTVPGNAVTAQTFARFRWSTTVGLDSTTVAEDGEVEDYALTIAPGYASGDAPSCAVPVPLDIAAITNGQQLSSADLGIILGSTVLHSDAGHSGSPKGSDTGSLTMRYSNDGLDQDQYEILFTNPVQIVLTQGSGGGWFDQAETWTVTATGGTLSITDTGRTSNGDLELGDIIGDGTSTVSFVPLMPTKHVPPSDSNWRIVSTPLTAIRFDFRESGNTNTATNAGSLKIQICATDHGDAQGMPDASHYVQTGLSIGTSIDAEGALQNNAAADGDDTLGPEVDDEDGVTIPGLTRGVSAIIPVTVTQPSANDAYLQAWIDWNGNGDFTDSGEQIATNLQSGTSGTSVINISVNVPANATSNQTYARFRWSTVSGFDSTTAASDGEVEDYALTISSSLTGTIFEDVNYGGDAGRDQISASGVGVNGVTVELYDATGAFVRSTTTVNDGTNDGRYEFMGVADGDYYIRVVNNTVTSTRSGSDGTELAVQTFRTDGTTAQNSEVGGRNLSVADGGSYDAGSASTLDVSTFLFSGGSLGAQQAQSVQPVTVSSASISGIDFGYNFDTIVNTNDAGQGSLRQFINNANLLDNTGLSQDLDASIAGDYTSGDEVSIFMIPSAALSGTAAIFDIQAELPVSTDSSTHFDGRTQTLNISDSNSGTFGTATTVGLDGLTVNTVNRPEIWLNCSGIPDNSGDEFCMQIAATDNTVRSMGFYGSLTGTFADPSAALKVTTGVSSAGATLVTENVFGTLQDGSEPDWAEQNRRMGFLSEGVANVTNNYFAYNGYGVVFNLSSASGSTLSGNYMEHNGPNVAYGVVAGAADGDSVSAWDGATVTIEGNLIRDSREEASAAIDLGKLVEVSNAAAIIRNNTLINGYTANIGVYNGAYNTTITRNIITGARGTGSGQTGSGILVSPTGSVPTAVAISQNHIYANSGLGIDLDAVAWNNGDGPTLNDASDSDAGPNDLINFPQFSDITLSGGNLTLIGCAPAGAAVELFESDLSPSASSGGTEGDNQFGQTQDYGEGEVYLTNWIMPATGTACTMSADVDGNDPAGMLAFSQTIAVSSLASGSSVVLGDTLTATATVSGAGTSEFSAARLIASLDFGDAPASYGDSSHNVISGIQLGSSITVDSSAVVDADNASDDGVTIPANMVQGSSVTITANVTGAGGYLQAWIDWDGDGSFSAAEQIATDLQDGDVLDIDATTGTLAFKVTVPVTAVTTQTFARFRWSTAAGLNSTTVARDGEVEDYALTISGGKSLKGTIFEDVNYGGGAGRDQTSASGVGVNGVTVELYDSTGTFVRSTTTANDGRYEFASMIDGDYHIRVVSDTIASTRSGSDGTELAVQTFRTDSVTPVTDEVGGHNPAVADSAANSGAETLDAVAFMLSGGGAVQSLQAVTVAGSEISGIDFGFNFDTIVNTNDVGQGSLRQFILNSNQLTDIPNQGLNTGKETSVFMIPDGTGYAGTASHGALDLSASGVFTLVPASAFPAVTDSHTAIDASTQNSTQCDPTSTGGRELNIVLDGAGLSGGESGLTLQNSDYLVQGLSIGHFPAQGLDINTSANNGQVVCNHIGTDAVGTTATPNNDNGILISNVDNTVLGDASAAGRNVIAGNADDGVEINDATRVTVLGNYIGTNSAGTASLGGQKNGIRITNSDTLVIGNSTDDGRNVISGNLARGVMVNSPYLTTNSTLNLMIRGNYLGTDATGLLAVENTVNGVHTYYAPDVQVGGPNPADGNIASGNGEQGIFIDDASHGALVQNNYVGVGRDGLTPIGNGIDHTAGNTPDGIDVESSDQVRIYDNIISNSGAYGIEASVTTDLDIKRNKIGIDLNGAAAGNGVNTDWVSGSKGGIYLKKAIVNTLIGGSAADANIIANNDGHGILFTSDLSANAAYINQNRIFANTGLGIDLTPGDNVTINDDADSDTGANGLLNFPQFSQVSINGGDLTVAGCAPTASTIELFEADISLTSTSGAVTGDNQFGMTQDYGEGETYLLTLTEGVGEDTVDTPVDCNSLTDADGNDATGMSPFQWTVALPASLQLGDRVTATATIAGIGTSEFSAAKLIANLDFGDAPASYGDAAHILGSNVYIGQTVADLDAGTQHTANGGSDGSGDDANGVDDEDAYDLFPAMWSTQSSYRLRFDCSEKGAYVSGWIDLNQNGQFDAGEQNTDYPTQCDSSGRAILNWTGISGLSAGSSYARLRIGSDSDEVSSATGTASDGEVEDYPIVIQEPATPPGACNGVMSWLNTSGQLSDPAAHWTINWAALGINADYTFSSTMTGTNPKWVATSKALTDSVFADTFGSSGYTLGVSYPDDLSSSGSTIATITFDQVLPENTYMIVRDIDATDESMGFSNHNLGNLGTPSLWETQDPLASGANDPSIFASWDSVNQKLTTLSNGANNSQEAYVWPVTGLTNIRVTYQTHAGGAHVGFVSCVSQDFGDAPDTYTTSRSASGPQHGVINGVYLGSTAPDVDSDGQPSTGATGDGADEDGVSVLSALTTSNRTYSMNVVANNDTADTATLVGWIDFDGNGTFDADEAAIRSVPSGSNTNIMLSWSNIPFDINAGDSYLRLRLTTDTLTNQEPGGAKRDGEVEDHPITIITAGVTVSGRIFNDINVNAANDSSEEGVTVLPVVLYDTVNNTCVSTRTDGNGDYAFTGVSAGTYQVYEASRESVPVPTNCGIAFAKDPDDYLSTTGNVTAEFTVSNADISDQNFGDIKPPVFEPDNTGQVLPGNVVFYRHKLSTSTTGDVSFTSASNGNISAGWSFILYEDANCDGELNGSDASAPVSGSLSVAANDAICLINKVYAPANVAANDSYIQKITATFDYGNAIAGTTVLDVQDVTTAQQIQTSTTTATPAVDAAAAVPSQPAQNATPNVPATETTAEVPSTPYTPATGPVPAQSAVNATAATPEVGPSRLSLRKTVKNISKAPYTEAATANTAEPGDTLEYRIYYSNTGTGPLTTLVINDMVPAYTSLIGVADCGIVPAGMGCTASPPGLDDSLNWTFTGTLAGGSESSVSYQVLISK